MKFDETIKIKMKKILILLLSLSAVIASAQTSQTSAATAMTVSGDTVINAGNRTALIKATGVNPNTVSIQAVLTKVSGTVAGNTILQGSLDGTNFVNISTDTLKATNVTTNTKIWTVPPANYLYYRVSATGSGTMKATFKAWFLGR